MQRYPGCTLHQIAPYIGKIRPSLARDLVRRYSKEGDWVWDPFCGSGTIPLESRLLSRHVVAGDVNDYACVLTRAKLHAPVSADCCFGYLDLLSRQLPRQTGEPRNTVPNWVKRFFHRRTLDETLVLLSELMAARRYFIAGCLLGILHHQRPGFLSYPASHLVPYLRDRLYPRTDYPEAYRYRDPIPRLKAKIQRALKCPPPAPRSRFRVIQRSVLCRYLPCASMDAVVTSPPYMDALDYARDNRLRLWFLGVEDYRVVEDLEIRKIGAFRTDMSASLQAISEVIKPGGACVLMVGDVTRVRGRCDVAAVICELVAATVKNLQLETQWVEKVPNHRRARRNGRATRSETVLVFRRVRRRWV